MSYPSIHAQLFELGTTQESATDEQLQTAFIAAFQEDLSLGFDRVKELVRKLTDGGKDRVVLSLDPKSPEGEQFARLLGPDIPRQVLERHFGVALGFYNCCDGVVATDRSKLDMSLREQIQIQRPDFVHC